MRAGRAAALSDTGRRRRQNEDAYVCNPPLFAVADGMGGHHAGEIASGLAAAALEEREGELRGEQAIAQLIVDANDRIYRAALENPAAAGMGTTVTGALVGDDGTIAIGHVGDSRAYRLRNGQLDQLTTDHSLVAELMRSGRLTEEEALIHPQRSVITRAAGTEPTVVVDTLTVEVAIGDLYLLCSDGLTTMVDDAEILEILEREGPDPDRIAQQLVAAANRAGGEDNVTVVVFEIVGENVGIDPDAATAEDVSAPALASDPPAGDRAAPSRRHGAGHGGRLLALLALGVAIAAAVLIVLWSLR